MSQQSESLEKFNTLSFDPVRNLLDITVAFLQIISQSLALTIFDIYNFS